MESPKDHLHDVGAPAMVRDDHRGVDMESAADHEFDVQGRSDHRGEAMETAKDHAHDVGAPAMDRNDHRSKPMETLSDHAHDVSGK